MKTENLPDKNRLSAFHSHMLSDTVDLSPILEECMGETELLEELVSLFHLNALEFMGAAKIHISNSDFKALSLVAHKIKAGLTMMRSDGLHAIVELVQKECVGDQDLKHLEFLYNCFTSEYPTVKESIDRALTRLKQA